MRIQLRPFLKKELNFTGVFERFGSRTVRGHTRKTIMLRDIYNRDSEIFIDHVWLKRDKRFSKLRKLKQGDVINFVAYVDKYTKLSGNMDYGFKNVKNIVKVCEEES